MASAKTHAIVGSVAGLAVYALHKRINRERWTPEGAIGSICGGALCGILADKLEPAFHNPNHRQTLHSLTALVGMLSVYNKLGSTSSQKLMINVGIGGYASHLIMDAFTPKGLPLA
jgi:membrane-bound metal-dependent hydrolase YbcI (DUF457 family)